MNGNRNLQYGSTEKTSNKMEIPGIPNLTNNPPYFQNIPFENKKNMRNPSPHTNYDEKAYSEPHNLDNKSHLNFKSEKNEHNLEYIIIASKQYQDISKLYERSELKNKQQNDEISFLKKEINKLKQENVSLNNENSDLKNAIKRITEDSIKEKQILEQKNKEMETKIKKALLRNSNANVAINANKFGPRSIFHYPQKTHNSRQIPVETQKLNQEIFDINDPGELSSLILAMKLQSETMSEIDGVPLQTLLSNIADNNKIFGIPNFYEDQNEIIPGGEVDPDHMTYEQMLELGDQIGKVSKGLSLEEINRVLKKCLFFKGKMGKNQESCTICLKEFFTGECVHELVECQHIYHFQCIKDWLVNEKFCPICKKDVIK